MLRILGSAFYEVVHSLCSRHKRCLFLYLFYGLTVYDLIQCMINSKYVNYYTFLRLPLPISITIVFVINLLQKLNLSRNNYNYETSV